MKIWTIIIEETDSSTHICVKAFKTMEEAEAQADELGRESAQDYNDSGNENVYYDEYSRQVLDEGGFPLVSYTIDWAEVED